MARKFFYICAGMLMLALSYHFGFSTASAQAPSNPVVGIAGDGLAFHYMAVTANGDVYVTSSDGSSNWSRRLNVFGSATAVERETWGQVKSRYAPNPGTPTSQPSDR